jgi:hypothetical protein
MSHTVAFKQDATQEDERLVFGEVYIPMVPDSDNEFMDAVSIKKMAYEFMRRKRQGNVDKFHTNVISEGASVVESFIARKGDPLFTEGAWVVGVHIPDDDDWAKVKKGKINGFSMEAFVVKTPVEVEMDLPCTIPGKTMKAEGGDVEDHEHEFMVTYDESGKFIGGRTSVEKGHYHVIKRGTLTEGPSSGASHHHKFSHVEALSMREVG